MKCLDQVIESKLPCQEQKCRCWMDYSRDLNCAHVAIIRNGKMKLEQVGERLNLTASRIKQIQDEAAKKIQEAHPKLKVLIE